MSDGVRSGRELEADVQRLIRMMETLAQGLAFVIEKALDHETRIRLLEGKKKE